MSMLERWYGRAMALVAGSAAVLTLGGCFEGHIPPWTGHFYAAPLMSGSITTAVAVSTTAYTSHGPHVSFVNESDQTLSVRYWVGRVDCREPDGVADWLSPHAFEVAPGEKVRHSVGRMGWATGNSDAVVRVVVVPTDDDSAVEEPLWRECTAPTPYFIRATGTGGLLALEAGPDSGPLKPVPQAQWIPNANGVHPDYGPAALTAAGYTLAP